MESKEAQLEKEMADLVNKWKGLKGKPPFMSKEYINYRIDRLRYRKLKNKLNLIRQANHEPEKDILKIAQEVFGTDNN